MALPEMTAEQRELYRQQAAEKRRKAQVYARENLNNDFADDAHWRRLASQYGIRLPVWYDRSSRAIRRAMKALGLDGSWVHEVIGFGSLRDFMDANPRWPSYAFVGLALEYAHERDGSPQLNTDNEEMI